MKKSIRDMSREDQMGVISLIRGTIERCLPDRDDIAVVILGRDRESPLVFYRRDEGGPEELEQVYRAFLAMMSHVTVRDADQTGLEHWTAMVADLIRATKATNVTAELTASAPPITKEMSIKFPRDDHHRRN